MHAVGLDFLAGSFTHTIRFSYLKFQNQIADATTGAHCPSLTRGGNQGIGTGLYVGPNLLAPQSTPQSNHQVKYDGSKSIHSHILPLRRFVSTIFRVAGSRASLDWHLAWALS